MSYVTATPDMVTAAARDLAGIRSALNAATAAAAAPTTGVVAAAADEVSTAISGLFGAYGEEFQAVSARAAAFHEQFVSLLNGSAAAYLGTELSSAQNTALNAVSAPARTSLGHPFIPTGGSSPVSQGVGAIMAAGRGAVATAAGAVQSGATVAAGQGAAIATGLQSVSASLLGTPAALPLLSSSAAAAAQADIAGPYQDLVANTTANLQSLGSAWAANPAPFLSQIVANQMAYGQTIATALQSGDLSPIMAIPGQIQQNLANVGNALLTDAAPAVAFAAAGPSLSTLRAFGTSLNAFNDAVQTGDVVGAFGALIDAPAVVADGFLNGEVTLPFPLFLGLGFVVLDVPFDGILVASHATTGHVTWFLPPFQDDITGPVIGGLLPTLLNAAPQQLAAAITPA